MSRARKRPEGLGFSAEVIRGLCEEERQRSDHHYLSLTARVLSQFLLCSQAMRVLTGPARAWLLMTSRFFLR
jgi:hypothetical protein